MATVLVMNDREAAADLAREIKVRVLGSVNQESIFQQEMSDRGLDDHDAIWYMMHKILFPIKHLPR